MLIGLISDTHGVCDPEVIETFKKWKVSRIIHAGDIGNHGGHVGGCIRVCAVCLNNTESILETHEHTIISPSFLLRNMQMCCHGWNNVVRSPQ